MSSNKNTIETFSKEYTEAIKFQPQTVPGLNDLKLHSPVSIRGAQVSNGGGNGGQYSSKQQTINNSPPGPNGITGAGFTPKYVKITACLTGTGYINQSTGAANPGELGTCVTLGEAGNTQSTNRIFLLRNPAGLSVMSATLLSFDSDGITLDFQTVSAGTLVLQIDFFG